MKHLLSAIFVMIIAAFLFGMPVSAAEGNAFEIQEPVIEEYSVEIYLKYYGTNGLTLMINPENLPLEEEAYYRASSFTVSSDGSDYHEPAGSDMDSRKLHSGLHWACLLQSDPLMLSYMRGNVNSIYIAVELVKYDDIDTPCYDKTIVAKGVWHRPMENLAENYDAPGERMVYHGFPSNLQQRIFVNMNRTGTIGAVVELPTKIPVVLQLWEENASNPVWLEEYSYPIQWETEPFFQNDTKIIYDYRKIESPSNEEVLRFYYKDRWYQVGGGLSAFPEIREEDLIYIVVQSTVNLVKAGYQSPISLTRDYNHLGEAISVELPYQPTDASRIEVQVSTDGGTVWNGVSEVDLNKYPIDAMPKFPGYSAGILTEEEVRALSSEGQGGFWVRLKIYGGPLGNAVTDDDRTYTITETASWPSEYVYTPPSNFSGDHGAGGNKGDVGTDNSGSTEGVRPGVDNEANKTKEEPEFIELIPVPQEQPMEQAVFAETEKTEETPETPTDSHCETEELTASSAEQEPKTEVSEQTLVEDPSVVTSSSKEREQALHWQKTIAVIIAVVVLIVAVITVKKIIR